MSLVVCNSVALRTVESAIVGACHGLTDTNGDKVMVNTIDSRVLKTAALLAIQIATGQVVWPGDEVLHIAAPKMQQSAVRIG